MPKPSRWLGIGALAVTLPGCFGTPSPLAPGLHGSVGLPNQGVLTDAVELPVSGTGFERYRPTSSHYWGVPRLVAAIEDAAAYVTRVAPGGVPLSVGDLSSRDGGKIPNHASHRSGRDADLLYFVSNVYGHPVESPGFVSIGSDGLAADPTHQRFIRLDVERQWLLTRALLTDPRVELLWLFVSRDVEALVVQQARALGEPNDIVWRAEQVLHQPRDSAPHDDHMHVRIACTPDETLAGCQGGGPRWPWFPDRSDWRGRDVNWANIVANDEPVGGESSFLSHAKESKLQ